MAPGIAPPKEHLDLGEHVRFHHRACVARLRKGGWEAIRMEGGEPPHTDEGGEFGLGESFVDRMKTVGVNKTIVIWPQEGEGIVVGLIRRGIGNSHPGYTSGYEYPEYEPGYFVAKEWHWLYVVKTHIRQKDPIYVPLWACAAIAT